MLYAADNPFNQQDWI